MPDIYTALSRYPTQRAAAEAWGLSTAYVSDMARGRKAVSARVAVAIETATGISARDLLMAQVEKSLDEARKRVAAERQSA